MLAAADQLYTAEVTVPAGTTKAAPQVTGLDLPRSLVPAEWTITVPPGPNGDVGFALAVGTTPILPRNPGGWIVANDRVIVWPVDVEYLSGAWALTAYNLGAYDHTLYVEAAMLAPGTMTAAPGANLAAVASLTGGA